MATASDQGPSSHKRFSPSGLKQRRLCPGSLAMEESMPESERSGDTVASRRGTCAHAVGEMAIESYLNGGTTTPAHFEGQEIEGVIVDDLIVEGSTHYYDNCLPVIDICGAENVYLEKRYSLAGFIEDLAFEGYDSSINPADTGGTADLTAVSFDWGTLYVRDYKNGRGIVEVENNDQLLSYALGALLEFDCDDIDDVEMGIDQPNAVHGSGETLRTWTVPKEHVYKWAKEEMIPIMEECLDGVEAFREGDPDFVQNYIKPSDDACMWCSARGRCQGAMDKGFEDAMIEFEEVLTDDDTLFPDNMVAHFPDINRLGDDQIAMILGSADQIEGFIKAVRELAHRRAEGGQTFSTHKIVTKNTHRRLHSGMQSDAEKQLKRLGLRPLDYMTVPKLRSPNQIETALTKKGVERKTIEKWLTKFVEKPDGGTQLVPMNDSRKAVQPFIEAEFEELFDDFGGDDLDLDLGF